MTHVGENLTKWCSRMEVLNLEDICLSWHEWVNLFLSLYNIDVEVLFLHTGSYFWKNGATNRWKNRFTAKLGCRFRILHTWKKPRKVPFTFSVFLIHSLFPCSLRGNVCQICVNLSTMLFLHWLFAALSFINKHYYRKVNTHENIFTKRTLYD